MSKVDAQRAMREARFAAYRAKVAASAPVSATAEPRKPAESRKPAQPREPAESTTAAEPATPAEGPAPDDLAAAAPAVVAEHAPAAGPGGEQLCGHRNMGNKSCKRPAGHAEKSHRYK